MKTRAKHPMSDALLKLAAKAADLNDGALALQVCEAVVEHRLELVADGHGGVMFVQTASPPQAPPRG